MASLTKINYGVGLLHPVRQWLEAIEIHDPKVARLLCKLIPAQCPFERHIKFNHTVIHIPHGHFAQRGKPPHASDLLYAS